jgi:hypothetical protein
MTQPLKRNTGKPFENEIQATCDQYERWKLARIRKVDPPTIVVKGRVIMRENPFLDFVGTIAGRLVMFEAKSTAEPRLPLVTAGISESQLAAADQWEAAGAIVFYLWRFGDATKFVSTGVPRDALADDRRSVRWDNPRLLSIGQGHGFATVDFLPLVKVAWKL